MAKEIVGGDLTLSTVIEMETMINEDKFKNV